MSTAWPPEDTIIFCAGTLPESWGDWTSLRSAHFSSNSLQGVALRVQITDVQEAMLSIRQDVWGLTLLSVQDPCLHLGTGCRR